MNWLAGLAAFNGGMGAMALGAAWSLPEGDPLRAWLGVSAALCVVASIGLGWMAWEERDA